MLELAVALILPAAIGLPHALPLDRTTPVTAASVWVLALALRALVAIGGAIFFLVSSTRAPAVPADTRLYI